ncbi:MAG TPA: DUF5666 domain-containing protein, partial [Blastocatellia bacterium]
MKNKIFSGVSMLALILGLFVNAFAGHDNENKFTGTVERLPSSGFVGDWTVAGRTVHVTSATRINEEDGHITVGAVVKVEGQSRPDGSVNATEIELRQAASGGGAGGDDNRDGQAQFKGTIESFPAGFVGDWRVGGRTIHVSSSTRIETNDGSVVVGAFVEIEG